jgi:hypothetical protein
MSRNRYSRQHLTSVYKEIKLTDTCDELAANEIHEQRMRDDIEYAIQFRKDEVYGDLVNFHQFMDDYQMNDQIARELLRALCNVEFMHKSSGGLAVMDAISNIKNEIDAKIEYLEKNK